jgi:hypothetical protein
MAGVRNGSAQTGFVELSKDPLLVDKVRDVAGLYLNPPERAVVLCVGEKTQIHALNRTQPVFPMLPATAEQDPRIHSQLLQTK